MIITRTVSDILPHLQERHANMIWVYFQFFVLSRSIVENALTYRSPIPFLNRYMGQLFTQVDMF